MQNFQSIRSVFAEPTKLVVSSLSFEPISTSGMHHESGESLFAALKGIA